MSDSSGPDKERKAWPLTLQIVSAGLIAVIFINLYIMWYFLIGMPSSCSALAVATAGRGTCGPGPAVSYIVVLNGILIAASIFMLWRWFKREKNLN
jgi:hypothetical protein